ncbi:hypothetical protein ANANG_G00093570 [Anguilla anguilla]|uniref:Uncharacterized protein n=1 Tax=Anguilla anguilla TaxID=7936 RepID=A0A9D3MMK2_ANGAN|nr:hypothetical protein ANANG_G00093570 [Anguilla anguilla]
MSLQLSILALVLVAVSVCQAQTGRLTGGTTGDGGAMKPWLVGMAAVVGFLFIVFTLLIIKRLLRKDRGEEESSCDNCSEKGIEEAPEIKQTNL